VRVRGRNPNGIHRWGRVCEIVDARPWEIAWRTQPTLLYPDSSEWRISLHPLDDGARTRIVQTFQVIRAPGLLEPVYATLIPDHRDRNEALTGDLRRLGTLAATPHARPTVPQP
jgi:hypothetical protein